MSALEDYLGAIATKVATRGYACTFEYEERETNDGPFAILVLDGASADDVAGSSGLKLDVHFSIILALGDEDQAAAMNAVIECEELIRLCRGSRFGVTGVGPCRFLDMEQEAFGDDTEAWATWRVRFAAELDVFASVTTPGVPDAKPPIDGPVGEVWLGVKPKIGLAHWPADYELVSRVTIP